MVPIEYRLLPAMAGSLFVLGSLFWIAWTAKPAFAFYSPIFGTLLYVWGNMSVLVSAISYLFDAYPARGTLSALTAAACFRLASAGLVSLVIIQMITGLTGAWAYSTFGFLSVIGIPLPWLLFEFGPTLRMRSAYGPGPMAVQSEMMGREMSQKMMDDRAQNTMQFTTGSSAGDHDV